ncbi:MAG: crcB protein [Planctomycetota bacterium]|nr:crcB protein [Planctomycetota bacterium]
MVLSLGGALGVNARYWLAVGIERLTGTRFPWATLAINVSGAFVLGLLATMMARLQPHHPMRLLMLVGFLGGYTTFSTFALESHKLWETGESGRSLGYMLGSVGAGFAAVALGILIGRSVCGGGGPYPQRPAGAEARTTGGGVEGAELAELA